LGGLDYYFTSEHGLVQASEAISAASPASGQEVSGVDTAASVILCLRESGYEAEASAFEEAFITCDDPLEQLDFARLGFSLSDKEFEKLFVPWLEAGKFQASEHQDLMQSLAIRRQESVG
jgi:hypothetical protein